MDKLHRHSIIITAATTMVAAICFSCASVGTPDGGPYDETPPRFIGSNPAQGELGVNTQKITIDFDEYIKLENASEKVVISPPQKDQAEITVNGKKIQVTLLDSLKENTTYTIDFSDGISDNNEGNPMGDFCFNFSTGQILDTMQVSGYVLDAKDLEPIQGIQVGLHENLSDTAFTTSPFVRISRTDSKGHFVIKGIRPGSYRIYALQDMDQNYYLSQKSELLAWSDSLIIPDSEQRIRIDTVFDIEHNIDTLLNVKYTRFTPDDIILLAFQEAPIQQYLSGYERDSHQTFSLYFSIPQDTLPILTGLNFDAEDAYIVEHNATRDTIKYWMTDSLIYYQDTLMVQLDYLASDTNMVLVPHTDTLKLTAKKSREKMLDEARRKAADEKKNLEKELRRLERQGDSLGIIRLMQPKTSFLPMQCNARATMDINATVKFDFQEPLTLFPPEAIHITHHIDSLTEDMPFILEQDTLNIRSYLLYAEWRPEESYTIKIDSASIYGLYGLHNNTYTQKIKFAPLSQYSTFTVNVSSAKPGYTVEILNNTGKTVRSGKLEHGSIDFFFLKPGKYYVRLFDDVNGNGVWDTGLYDEKRQAESVYYIHRAFDLKQNWEHETELWDVTAAPLYLQKPDALIKNKSKEKAKTSKNAERDKAIAERAAKKNNKKKSKAEEE